jgi:hypothetical protein
VLLIFCFLPHASDFGSIGPKLGVNATVIRRQEVYRILLRFSGARLLSSSISLPSVSSALVVQLVLDVISFSLVQFRDFVPGYAASMFCLPLSDAALRVNCDSSVLKGVRQTMIMLHSCNCLGRGFC